LEDCKGFAERLNANLFQYTDDDAKHCQVLGKQGFQSQCKKLIGPVGWNWAIFQKQNKDNKSLCIDEGDAV